MLCYALLPLRSEGCCENREDGWSYCAQFWGVAGDQELFIQNNCKGVGNLPDAILDINLAKLLLPIICATFSL